MKKIKLFGYLAVILGLFIVVVPKSTDAFSAQSVCQAPLKDFSNGNSTFDVSFPPGGGTTCDTIADCPKISLPANSQVYSVKVDMVAKGEEIGTPYVWAPVSSGNIIKQVDSSDCNIIGSYSTGTNPSRTFVVPGGDVWVANRGSGNVTKLSPLTGNQPAGGTCGDSLCGTDETIYSCSADCSGNICGDGTEDCKKYKVIDNYPTGSLPRGVTGDVSGNVWVGNFNSGNVSKLNSATGAKLITDVATGVGPYGLVGDQFGHIWISNRGSGSLQCLESATGVVTTVYDSINLPYGIGMGKDGSVYVACYECGTALKFNAVTTTACPSSMTPSVIYNTGVTKGARGVAVDQNDNVWVANSHSNRLYVFKNNGTLITSIQPGGTDLIGAAIDSNGNGWTVSYDSGKVYKYSLDGSSLKLECSATVGGHPYNYSDMTGLRTVPKSLTMGGSGVITASDKTFNVCSDGTETCTDATSCLPITTFLSTCTPDAMNNCEIPLKIFSMQVGDYTLKNLEVIYGEQTPITTGGIVPCGREWNDPATPWNDTDPCNFCYGIMLLNQIMGFLMKIASAIAILALVIDGFLFITSAGNPERKNQAKTYLKWILLGFLILFLSWLIVDFVLSAWGYLDPLGGKWNVVCD